MANNAQNYGFVSLANVLSDHVTKVNQGQVANAIAESLAEYNDQSDGMQSVFVTPTVLATELFLQPGQGTLQPLDKDGWGNPIPEVEKGSYSVAYPIQAGGYAFGSNRVSRAFMTVGDVDRQVTRGTRNDVDWRRRHILGAIFYDQSWTFTDPLLGALTVQPLANGDTNTYVRVGGSAPTTDDHYIDTTYALTGGAGSQLASMFTELSEHPGNGSDEVLVFMNATQRAEAEALGAGVFYPTPVTGVQQGSNTAQYVGANGEYMGPGQEIFGKASRCVLVEWKALPDNYMIGVALNTEPPLAMREYDAPALQGLFMENNSPDGNLQETRFIRYAGYSARNRVAACVCELSSVGSYTGPTNYQVMPLPE